MKQITYERTYAEDGRQWPICIKPGQGAYLEILGQAYGQLRAMLAHHCKILVLRLDLHTREFSKDSGHLSRLLRTLKRRLSRRYSFSRIGHIWAREIENAPSQHYHLALILDANKLQHPGPVLAICEEVWGASGMPKPYTPKNCYYLIKRGDEEAFQSAFYRLSYLAKTRGKGIRGPTCNDYSASRVIPPRPTEHG